MDEETMALVAEPKITLIDSKHTTQNKHPFSISDRGYIIKFIILIVKAIIKELTHEHGIVIHIPHAKIIKAIESCQYTTCIITGNLTIKHQYI